MIPKRHTTSQRQSTHNVILWLCHRYLSCKLRCRICSVADVRIGIWRLANLLTVTLWYHNVLP